MASRIPTMFDAYELTEDESKAAQFFTDANILYLKTLRAVVAMEKISIEYDPKDPMKFMQNEAVLRGKIDVLTLLIGD